MPAGSLTAGSQALHFCRDTIAQLAGEPLYAKACNELQAGHSEADVELQHNYNELMGMGPAQ